MKKLLTSLLLLSTLVFGSSIDATQSTIQPTEKELCKTTDKSLTVERSGCCSWHGGVAGCSGGRQVCNDGTYSPSCTCNIATNPFKG